MLSDISSKTYKDVNRETGDKAEEPVMNLDWSH